MSSEIKNRLRREWVLSQLSAGPWHPILIMEEIVAQHEPEWVAAQQRLREFPREVLERIVFEQAVGVLIQRGEEVTLEAIERTVHGWAHQLEKDDE